jgi:HD-GYP domain-containing protein (c-di-GMP phosphodiesterase class II)
MIPSRSISDYREVSLDSIPVDRPISFRVFIYFKNSDHVVCLWNPGTQFSTDQIQRYQQKGLRQVWIYSPEYPAYENFLKPPIVEQDTPQGSTDVSELAPPEPNAPSEIVATEPTPPEENTEDMHLQEGELLKRVLRSPVLSDGEKKSVASTLSQTMIERIAAAPTAAHQSQELQRARRLVGSLIDHLGETVHEDLKKVWDVAHFDKDLQHGVQVATFSTLFALAFGRIDEGLLSELALAGLIHDVGMCRMRPKVASMPLMQHSAPDQAELQNHVQESLDLLAKHLPNVSERVREIIFQHQEMFDGSGYPRGLEGFDFDDIAQLVAMADLAETVRCGLWDGEERSFRDAFVLIETLEQTKTFPHFFNPEVFRQVVHWTQRDETPATLEAAAKRVAKETLRVVKKAA